MHFFEARTTHFMEVREHIPLRSVAAHSMAAVTAHITAVQNHTFRCGPGHHFPKAGIVPASRKTVLCCVKCSVVKSEESNCISKEKPLWIRPG